ncbi:MAG: uroporphyrinogen-III synthase [Hydrococcus sp. RM1_1_31]|nr:uroporphyrinogen-III synthase [Hydrococcus sp. RM1_1_31]
MQSDFIPPNFVADSLVENFPESLSHKKILFPRVETGGREILVKELTAKGAEVVEVAAYQSACPDKITSEVWKALKENKVDIITFASSKTVRNFYQLIELALKNDANSSCDSLLKNLGIASIGPQTSKTCYELLGRVDVEATEYTLEGLIEAIVKSIYKNT